MLKCSLLYLVLAAGAAGALVAPLLTTVNNSDEFVRVVTNLNASISITIPGGGTVLNVSSVKEFPQANGFISNGTVAIIGEDENRPPVLDLGNVAGVSVSPI